LAAIDVNHHSLPFIIADNFALNNVRSLNHYDASFPVDAEFELLRLGFLRNTHNQFLLVSSLLK